MAKKVGKNINSNDEAFSASYSVGSSVAVTILLAQQPEDPPFSEVNVTNNGNRRLWVRKRAASVDNLKDGISISPRETYKIVKNSENYTGEISAIFNSGGFSDVYVEWF